MTSNRKRARKAALFCITFVLAMMLGLSAAWADGELKDFDIEAQPLAKALLEFSRQADRDVIVPSDLVGRWQSGGISGRMSPEEALNGLLEGSGLTLSIGADGSYRIVSTAPLSRYQEVPDSEASGRGAPGVGEDPEKEAVVLEEIVVTGSRLRRFGGDGPSPVVTFDRESIRDLGATDIGDVLDYLPQNSFSFSEDFLVGGARPVQLRGLSLGTTLVLINGRRVVTSAVQGTKNFFDLNTIPLAAVERIEVLSDSASAVYGADAIGGVVNIILRNQTEHPTVDLYYGTAEGGGDEKRISASGGFESDRLRSIFGADYFERDYLLGDKRERFFNQDYTRFGGPDYRSIVTNPGNVISLGGPLPGLSSNQAGIPAGTNGVGLTPEDFAGSQGAANLNRESLRRFNSVIPESERISAFANAEYDLTFWATFFAELMYTERDDARQLPPTTLSSGSISNTAGTQGGILVPAVNPYNAFGVPVLVNYLFDGVGPREEVTETDFLRIASGIKGDGGQWTYELSYLHTEDAATSYITNEVSPTAVITALNQTDPGLALNLFADGPGGNADLLRSLVGDPHPNEFDSRADQFSGFISGPVFRLPAGEVSVVLGGEWRKERLELSVPSQGVTLDASRKTSAAFGEILIPVIGSDMDVPLVDQFILTAAGRYDHYSDFGGTFNPKFGVEWRPTTDLLLRGSWGTSYRAPSLFELYFSGITQTGQFPDPLRPPQFPGLPGELVVISLTAGGNADLKPEEAETLTVGLVFQPQAAKDLDISFDYFNIQQDLRVQSPDAFTLIRNGAHFPDRVIRAPQTPADIAAGLPGQLLALNLSRLNLGSIRTDGLDFRIRYRWETSVGILSPSFSATWVNKFEVADFPGLPLEDRVAVASSDGTVPRWRAVASLNWGLGGWQLGATTRFTDSYQDRSVQGEDLERRLPAKYYVDLQGSYSFGSASQGRLVRGLTARLGITNLFNEGLDYSDINIIGYDPSQSDVRGRFIYLGLSKTF